MRPYRHPTSHLVRLAYQTGPVRSGRATGVLSGLTQLRGFKGFAPDRGSRVGLLPLGNGKGGRTTVPPWCVSAADVSVTRWPRPRRQARPRWRRRCTSLNTSTPTRAASSVRSTLGFSEPTAPLIAMMQPHEHLEGVRYIASSWKGPYFE
jgi:hypothetical protein